METRPPGSRGLIRVAFLEFDLALGAGLRLGWIHLVDVPVVVPLTTTETPGSGLLSIELIILPVIVFCASTTCRPEINRNASIIAIFLIGFLD